jgi:hypothetical protein
MGPLSDSKSMGMGPMEPGINQGIHPQVGHQAETGNHLESGKTNLGGGDRQHSMFTIAPGTKPSH